MDKIRADQMQVGKKYRRVGWTGNLGVGIFTIDKPIEFRGWGLHDVNYTLDDETLSIKVTEYSEFVEVSE